MKPSSLIPAMILAATTTLFSCGKDEHLSQGKMADVMADMQLAEAYASNHYDFSSDSARNVLRMSVLEKHGVTQEEYDRTIKWYAHHLESYNKLYEEVEKRLDNRQNKLLASVNNDEESTGGSLWPYSAMAMISPESSQDAIQFSIPVSELSRGERLVWKMRLSESAPTQMLLGVDYTDGTTSYALRRTSQKNLELTLQSDSSRNVNRVYGYMRPDHSVRLPIWADSILLQNMPLAKETYHQIQQQNNYNGPKAKTSADTIRKHQTIKPITDQSVAPTGRPGATISTGNMNQ